MNPPLFDTLSAPVRQLLATARAGGTYEQLVVRQKQMHQRQQEQEQQQQHAHDALERLSINDLFDAKVMRPDDARCALAGLWLYFDELDRAHRIVQEITSSNGSFWHAIVHRREGDFANSRYWYARCGDHPVLRIEDALSDQGIKTDGTALKRVPSISGAELVDLVEEVLDLPAHDARRDLAVQLQHQEWTLLFYHCVICAVGGA